MRRSEALARRHPSALLALLLVGCAAPQGQRPAGPPEAPPRVRPGEPAPSGPAAQPRPGAADIPEVVIVAGRDEGAAYRTPLPHAGGRDVIGPEEVRASGALNAQELLRRTPGVYFFEETGTDSKPNIAVRGVTSTAEGSGRSANVSLLADGIPLAPAPYGHAGQSLFPFTLERVHAVDLIRGGRTVRYGPNTVGGIINFLTRPIPERTTIEQILGANSYGDWFSYTGAGTTLDRLGVWAEAVYKKGDTYRDHGDFTIQNYALKAAYDFSEALRGLVQLEWFDDYSRLADGLSLAAFRDDPTQNLSRKNRFEGDQLRANFRLEWTIDERSRLDLSGYAFTGDRTFHLGSPSFYGRDPNYVDATPRPMSVWAIQPQYTRGYELGDLDGELVAGLRYQEEDITRKAERFASSGTKTVRSDNTYDYQALSIFVENSFRHGGLSVTPGVRIEVVDIAAKNELSGVSVDRDFNELLPALGASYMVAEEWSVYGNIQSSFQPPQANHVEISSNSQDFSAEYAWTYEIGTRSSMCDGLIAPDLTLYWINYKDRIERHPDYFDVFLNVGNTRHRGAELALESDLAALADGLEGLELSGTLAYNDSRFANGEFEGNAAPHAPSWLSSWAAKYTHAATGLWCMLDGCFVGSAFSDSENTRPIAANGMRGKRPGYTVWNLRAGWNVELAPDAALKTQVGCNNLFDEEFFEIRAGRGLYLGPPRGLYTTVGIVLQF